MFRVLLAILAGSLLALTAATAADSGRRQVAEAMLAPEGAQAEQIATLSEYPEPAVKQMLELWQRAGLYLYETPEGTRIPVFLNSEAAGAEGRLRADRVDSGTPLEANGAPLYFKESELKPVETTSRLRRAIKGSLDLLALADPDPDARKNAILKLGMKQSLTSLPLLEARLARESDPSVRKAIEQAMALSQLSSPEPETQIAALRILGQMHAIPARDIVKKMAGNETGNGKVRVAAQSAFQAIDTHLFWVDFFGTIFRGLSLGSVLLIVALGLAITFGLMGVINMAHGEIMVVGGYATFVIQSIFSRGLSLSPFGYSLSIPGFGFEESSAAYQCYFLVALPFAFICAALVGLVLERGVIQFLYRRPLESLLATWGVSLVLQQLFRLVFGPANAPVYSPAWLLGSFSVGDVIMNYNRVFVIGFAIFVVAGTALLLARTPLGLLIRAVMQNRTMASCMGVRTERVNMLTFAFGSGLAGLAGAFLSQIGNIGPSTGQTYIVDAFMVVVVGGVGNLIGTVISALGIGAIDQILQTLLRNPVIGKVLVLLGIILFLQWRPSGLFATRSRGLEG